MEMRVQGSLEGMQAIEWNRIDRRDGRDEMNLAEFPLAALSARLPRNVKTLEFHDTIYDRGSGEQITRKVVVSGSDKYGLLTCHDEEVFLGLIQYTKLANGFTRPDVWFSQNEVLRLIDWAPNGENYSRLRRAFQRLKGLTLYCQNAWWDKRTGSWQTFDEGIGVLEYFKLYDGRRQSKCSRVQLDLPLPRSQFVWNRVLFASFASGYLKKLDFEFWLQLDNAVAKRMYRFLDKRFYRSDCVELELRNFACEHVGLSRAYDTGKLKEKLRSGIEELEEKGYLVAEPAKARYKKIGKGVWHIVLKREQGAHEGVTVQLAVEEELPKPAATVDRLVECRVGRRRANELTAKYEARIIEEVVDYVAWKNGRLRRDERLLGGGFVVRAIELHAEGNFVFDDGFTTKAEREAVERRRLQERIKAAQEAQRARDEADIYREQLRQQKVVVEMYIAGLSRTEKEELRKAAIADASKGQRMMYDSSELTQVDVLYTHLRRMGKVGVSPGNKRS